MNILGVSYIQGSHDTSSALVCDGELIAAAEEERFTRRKHESALPVSAIDFCLRRAGLCMSQVDILACPELPFRSGPNSPHGEMELSFIRRLNADRQIRYRSLIHKRALDLLRRLQFSFDWQMSQTTVAGLSALREIYGDLPPTRFYDHHRAHAAAAYFTSGLDRAAIATLDGYGQLCSSVAWLGEGTRISRVRAEPFYNSLGTFYLDCTNYIGFPEYAEGKTMGLASYGNWQTYAEAISSMLRTNGSGWYQYRRPPSPELLGFPPRDREFILRAPYTDFAAGAQYALQQAVQRVACSAMDEAMCSALCLGGGVALNCTSNGALLASGMPSSIWAFPATSDAGLSVGAALLGAAQAGELERVRMDHAYWGPEFSPAECEAELSATSGLVFRRVSSVATEIARCLATGQVVGWFQGRMEFGPRALGNRSILADPRKVEMRDRVNKIKGRELWRPLSPAVLAERAPEFFNLKAPSPFMLFATQVRPEARAIIPAVVHVDGSARPQTVTREQNPRLHELISVFSELTGVPVLLNTSFNAAGEPIVCTPADAIKTFLATELDILVLGDYVARRQAEVGSTESGAVQ